MRKKTLLAVLCMVCLLNFHAPFCSSAPAAENQLVIAENGKSDYTIVLPTEPSAVEKFAAEQLQLFLEQISGARLPVRTDKDAPPSRLILLGKSQALQKTGISIDFSKLAKEGFTIQTAGDNLIITGALPRGTLYGVYTFLEDYLSCRWYSSKVSRIPKNPVIKLGVINDTQVPVLDYREVYYADPMDPDFAARLKLNGNASTIKDNKMIAERHAGWATWCHTAFTFVPPDKYFAEHPEYYSFVDGKRQKKQLCLTNPNVLKITAEKIRQLTDTPVEFTPGENVLSPRQGGPLWADKQDRYWDISQMDWGGACQCPDCKAIDDSEGSHIGSVLTFINKLAAQFPDRIISTLSYQYTRKPPKNLRPADNVSIMLCNIECTRAVSIPDSTFKPDVDFRSDIEGWSGICRNLFVWDYIVNFGNLFTPNPNLRIQQKNIKYFIAHHTKGVFTQGSREVGGEFCELRNYLVAKLLWNPDSNVDALIDDFLAGYYGPANLPIRRYIDLMHDAAEKTGKPVGMNDHPSKHREDFLAPELIAQYDALFDEAKALTTNDPELLQRVKTAQMPLMYAKLEMGIGTPQQRLSLLGDFYDLCVKNGIQRLSEWGNSPDQFRAKHLKTLKPDDVK